MVILFSMTKGIKKCVKKSKNILSIVIGKYFLACKIRCIGLATDVTIGTTSIIGTF